MVLNLHKAVGNYCDIAEKVQLLDDKGLQDRFVALRILRLGMCAVGLGHAVQPPDAERVRAGGGDVEERAAEDEVGGVERRRAETTAARQMLETTGKTLVEIAQETGFYDLSHFTRAFKKERKTTPGHYRRQYLSMSAK